MAINYLHIHGGVIFPSVHAICPLGGLENLWSWVGGKANLQKLFSGTMTLFFFTLVFVFIFGRAFCGNICPFGTLQEFFGKISGKKIELPFKIDRILRFAKYLILVFITVMAWITATIWISPYDPIVAFSHIWAGPGGIAESGIAGFIFLLIIIFASIFIDRFFCKYFCPAGAMYGVIAKISPLKIKRNKSCDSCGKCSKACLMNINVSETEIVKSPECIVCGECIAACPVKKKDIKITLFGKNIKSTIFIAGTVLVFFVGLGVFDKMGLLQITVPKLSTIQEDGKYLKIVDLRGSMTIEMGAKYTGKDLKEFYNIMEIPLSIPKETLLKNVSLYLQGYDFHVIKARK
jgi:polyferredoxin